MPIPFLAFNLVASLRAAPASTSRPVHQVRVQQKSTRRPRANSRGANGVCFDAATRRTDHAWAYRGSAWLDRTSPRVTRGLPPVFRRVHHRPSALTRARPFVTLGRSPAERGTDLKYRGDDGRPFRAPTSSFRVPRTVFDRPRRDTFRANRADLPFPSHSPPHQPQGRAGTMTVRAFRLDELGGSRSRRAATSPKRVAKLNRDLIESPSRRVGRISKDKRQGAGVGDRIIETSAMRDAKSPLLGILDDLGDRVSRQPAPNKTRPNADANKPMNGASSSASPVAANNIKPKKAPPVDKDTVLKDGDILEAIGTRGRAPSCTLPAKNSEKLTLDLLAVPDGRANGARKTPPTRSPGRGKQARDALDLLSGPGRRTGRN